MCIFSGLSYGSTQKALKKVLHFHPYKVQVVQELKEPDSGLRLQYCHWFNQNLNDNDILDISFFSDEAWFHLSGYVNSQNYRTWGAENPHVFMETTLHPIKVGVWVAMSRRRIIGPIFFQGTVTAEVYRNQIIDTFLNELHDDELQYGFFQQDGAPAHTSRETLRYLEEYFGERLISLGRYPPRSPDLTPLDFCLFGRLKNNIYKRRLHTAEELKLAIQREIENVTQNDLENIFENMKRRVHLCIANNGHHFETEL